MDINLSFFLFCQKFPVYFNHKLKSYDYGRTIKISFRFSKAQQKRAKSEDDKKTYQIRINLIKFLLNANVYPAKKY